MLSSVNWFWYFQDPGEYESAMQSVVARQIHRRRPQPGLSCCILEDEVVDDDALGPRTKRKQASDAPR